MSQIERGVGRAMEWPADYAELTQFARARSHVRESSFSRDEVESVSNPPSTFSTSRRIHPLGSVRISGSANCLSRGKLLNLVARHGVNKWNHIILQPGNAVPVPMAKLPQSSRRSFRLSNHQVLNSFESVFEPF